MLTSLILAAGASTLSIAQVPASPAPSAVRTLKDVPGATIKYYDIAGKNLSEVGRSIAKKRPRGPENRQAAAAATSWNVDVGFNQRTENGVCKISKAEGTFTATAEIPRLTTEGALTPEAQAAWQAYLAGLDTAVAASLGFVYDRVDQVEAAILASSCTDAAKVGELAIAKLKKDAAAFDRENRIPPLPADSRSAQAVPPNQADAPKIENSGYSN